MLVEASEVIKKNKLFQKYLADVKHSAQLVASNPYVLNNDMKILLDHYAAACVPNGQPLEL